MRTATQQQNQSQGWDSRGEAAKLRRAMLDACGKSLRHRLHPDLQSPIPPTLSQLIDELKRVEALRRQSA